MAYEKESYNDIISWFEGVSETAGAVQTQTLRQILELNWGVEYLNKWLSKDNIRIQDLDDSELESLYTSSVPIATHRDFEPFIMRIAEGETGPILTQQPVTHFSRTSGTTEGRYKYIPFTRQYLETLYTATNLEDACIGRDYPTKEGGKILGFVHCCWNYKINSGLTVATVTSHVFGSQEFKTQQETSKSPLCSPVDVIFGEDYKQSTYCHLLLGLFFSDQVKFIFSIFAYTIVQAFSEFEELWQELCTDIREGTLSPRIACPKLRKAVLELISPNQILASKIEANCKELENSDWCGMLPMLWPNTKFVKSVITGSMQVYVMKLKHYAGNLPLVGSGYVCSESSIGVNIDPSSPPESVCFAVVPNASYFEFIPHKKICDSSSDYNEENCPVPLSKVKVGQEYEIVLTTFTGLYRRILGDVVRVVGFHKTIPKLKFLHRDKTILCIANDKTTEEELQVAIEKVSEVLGKLKAEIVDYTSHADVATQPGHYVIYLEIKGEVEQSVLSECCSVMDESFQLDYVKSRKLKSIGPLELRILEKGCFKKIMEYFVRNGGTLSQFKTPRSINNQGMLEILNACTTTRFHSTAHN